MTKKDTNLIPIMDFISYKKIYIYKLKWNKTNHSNILRNFYGEHTDFKNFCFKKRSPELYPSIISRLKFYLWTFMAWKLQS